MVSFFSLKFGAEYLWGGLVMVFTWFVIFYYIKQ